MSATISQISVNPAGGVPKLRVESARLGAERVEGDKQRFLKFHGGPQRAVCLFSTEIIEKLKSEGHPIAPGAAGENLTVSGLDWNEITPGVQLQIGEAVVEITDYTTPCKTIIKAFENGNFMRISQLKHPGESRLYAKVLVEAVVYEGDAVSVL
ncbi:MOSC domain-containing protein [bacterium]|nr:MAG: MOSC domain-containing protein [bacterium]